MRYFSNSHSAWAPRDLGDRHLSVSAIAGISMVRSDEHSLALMVGGSLFAWDGLP